MVEILKAIVMMCTINGSDYVPQYYYTKRSECQQKMIKCVKSKSTISTFSNDALLKCMEEGALGNK